MKDMNELALRAEPKAPKHTAIKDGEPVCAQCDTPVVSCVYCQHCGEHVCRWEKSPDAEGYRAATHVVYLCAWGGNHWMRCETKTGITTEAILAAGRIVESHGFCEAHAPK